MSVTVEYGSAPLGYTFRASLGFAFFYFPGISRQNSNQNEKNKTLTTIFGKKNNKYFLDILCISYTTDFIAFFAPDF